MAGAFARAGGQELAKPGLGGRRRVRLDLTDAAGRQVAWYVKLYAPPAWPLRLWRRLTGRGGAGPARRELENIRRVSAAGVLTMRPLAMGEECDWLGARRGYLVVSAVPGEALERCFGSFLARSRQDRPALAAFNAALVDLLRRLHGAGCVHRDLYASHVFLDRTPQGPRLYLIDLARVFAPCCRRFRWRVKDLAQLKYSMPPEWVAECWASVLEGYLAGGEPGRWAAAIDRKVAAMRARRQRRERGGRGETP